KPKRGTTPSRRRKKKQFPKAEPPTRVGPIQVTVNGPITIVGQDEVMQRIGVNYGALRSYIQRGIIPAPRVFGAGLRSRKGWLSNELDQALLNLPKRFPKGSKAVTP